MYRIWQTEIDGLEIAYVAGEITAFEAQMMTYRPKRSLDSSHCRIRVDQSSCLGPITVQWSI